MSTLRGLPSRSILWLFLLSFPIDASGADYLKDVRPILKEHCFECHGEKKQAGGLRLDKESLLTLGPNGRSNFIIPGHSNRSSLYQSMASGRMPPLGQSALPKESLGVIAEWIDGGAAVAEHAAVKIAVTEDARIVALRDALRTSNHAKVRINLTQEILDLRTNTGQTPLMLAALYGHSFAVRRLLKMGADPNAADFAGATAMMMAPPSKKIIRTLLKYGANPLAESQFGQTPLKVLRSTLSVREDGELLSKIGSSGHSFTERAQLLIKGGNSSRLKLAIETAPPLSAADLDLLALESVLQQCVQCLEVVLKQASSPLNGLGQALRFAAAGSDIRLLEKLLEAGAPPNSVSSNGWSPVMAASYSSYQSAEKIRLLRRHGARVDGTDRRGQTPIALAAARGDLEALNELRGSTRE